MRRFHAIASIGPRRARGQRRCSSNDESKEMEEMKAKQEAAFMRLQQMKRDSALMNKMNTVSYTHAKVLQRKDYDHVAMQENIYDFIVIGAGHGGSVFALRMAQKGYSVLLLEQGRAWEGGVPNDDWEIFSTRWNPALRMRGRKRTESLGPLVVESGVGLGGSSLDHVAHMEEPDPSVYTSGDWQGVVTAADMEPHFKKVKEMLGVATQPFFTEADGYFQDAARVLGLQDPSRASCAVFFGSQKPEKLERKGLLEMREERLRMQPYSNVDSGENMQREGHTTRRQALHRRDLFSDGDTSRRGRVVWSDPYFDGAGPNRSPCTSCGLCNVGCRPNAKNSLPNNYLFFAEHRYNCSVVTAAKATAVRFLGDTTEDDDSRYQVEVEQSREVPRRLFRNLISETKYEKPLKLKLRARNVAVCCGTVDTNRLLLDMKHDPLGLPSLPNEVGWGVRAPHTATVTCTALDNGDDGVPIGRDFTRGVTTTTVLKTDDGKVELRRYGPLCSISTTVSVLYWGMVEPNVPPLEEWSQRPLILRWSTRNKDGDSPKPGAVLKINSERTIPFETDLFKGVFHLSIRYVDNCEYDPWGPGGHNEGRKRKVVAYVQGEFKKRLAFDDVMFGFIWDKPLSPPRGIGVAMKVCEAFSPGTVSDVVCDKPYMLNIIAGGADSIHIWKPGDPAGEKLDPTLPHFLFERPGGDLPKFSGMKERAKWMHKKRHDGTTNASNCYYEPGWTYSFEFYTHLLFMNLFEVHFPLGVTYWKIHLDDYFNGQCYPICGVTKDGQKLWDFEVWHEKTTKHAGPDIWRKGPAKEELAVVIPAAPTSPPMNSVRSNAKQHVLEDSDEASMMSCIDEEGGDEGSEDSDTKEGPFGSPSPELIPLVPAVEKDDIGMVLWSGKRLRMLPRLSASWATKKKEIPQGCRVTILRTTDGWSEVKLPNGMSGWIQTHYLSKVTSMQGREPGHGTIIAKRKRVREQPKNKARRHGPYLSIDEEVHVITYTGHWALIIPPNGPAGWLKASNLRLTPDTPEGE
eukprot:TRINITY_DN7630_c0_g1_i3.p1 TRINITY_DN7630_c0_g1~~TRINITY_DN7630_c0_g1_i3.p1  ORF type:complete len:1034 (+),score=242.93 TRINITY_DN7630_c0_g1_i3:32-3103(+)